MSVRVGGAGAGHCMRAPREATIEARAYVGSRARLADGASRWKWMATNVGMASTPPRALALLRLHWDRVPCVVPLVFFLPQKSRVVKSKETGSRHLWFDMTTRAADWTINDVSMFTQPKRINGFACFC